MPDSHHDKRNVSVDHVIGIYVRYDFALKGVDPTLKAQAADNPATYDKRVEVLREKHKPWPSDARSLLWSKLPLSREMVQAARTPWKGVSVAEVVRRMEAEKREALATELAISAGSFDKIRRHAEDSNCGAGPGYDNVILYENKGVLCILDGTHRLCAVWLRFLDQPENWPAGLSGFIGRNG
jgi:hypothetical protein